MRFDLLCLANLGSGIPALVLAIFMASRGFGVWALVGQLVIGGILMRGWMFLCIQWSPGMYQRGAGIRSMLSFGGRNCAGIAVEFLYSKSQSLILGRFGTITEVGFYNRGQALFQRPFQQLAYPITSLLLPSMSGMQANKKALEAFTVQVMWLLSLLLLPLLVWIINCGEWIAYLLLGDAWLTSGAVMQWLAYAGLLMLLKRPLVAANAALGRPARGICLKLLLIVPFICLTIWASPQGAVAVAIVFALIRLIAFPFEQHLLLQGLGLNSRRLLTQMMQVLLVANVLNLLLAFLTARSVSVASLGAWGSEAGFLLGCLILCYLAGLAIFCIYKDARQVMRMVTRKMMSRLGLSK
jgi:PST family polysaccharide transporter